MQIYNKNIISYFLFNIFIKKLNKIFYLTMKYELLKVLLPHIEAFEENCAQDGAPQNLDNFVEWLVFRQNAKKLAANNKAVNAEFQSPSINLQGDVNAHIAQLLALMNKYLRFYLKKGFEGTLLSGPDDFGFMATLFIEGQLQKNVLIEKNTMEFSSGMEVIRRLEKQQLIESLTDESDKRAKIVSLTPLGKGTFFTLLPKMAQIGLIATAILSDEERYQLLELLNKLNHFHNPIFHDAKKDSLDELVERLMRS